MKRTALASVLIIAALGLTGCSSASGLSGSYSQPQRAEDGGAVAAPNGEKGVVNADGTTTANSQRSVITTGYITVTATEPIAAASNAITIVEGAGGRIDAREENAPVNGDKGSATLTLRIPAQALTPTIDKLKKLGEVQQVSISSTDVTGQVQDLDARIVALRASVDRLTALLATATDTNALVTIESSLSQRQADLESMESQQRSLGDEVDMATITLNLVSVADAPAKKPVNFLTGLQAGWEAFVVFLSGLIVVIGVLLPWLIFFGLIAIGVIALVRWRRSRRAAWNAVHGAPAGAPGMAAYPTAPPAPAAAAPPAPAAPPVAPAKRPTKKS